MGSLLTYNECPVKFDVLPPVTQGRPSFLFHANSSNTKCVYLLGLHRTTKLEFRMRSLERIPTAWQRLRQNVCLSTRSVPYATHPPAEFPHYGRTPRNVHFSEMCKMSLIDHCHCNALQISGLLAQCNFDTEKTAFVCQNVPLVL